LIKELTEQKKLINQLIDSVEGVGQAVKDMEYPAPARTIEITNLPEQKEFPESISIKKPNWLKQFSLSDLVSSLSALLSRRFRVDLDEYRTAKKAISVRLSDGQTFINQLAQAVSMAGGASGEVTVENFPDVGINLPEWNSLSATYPDNSTEVYTFKLGDEIVAVVTVSYTDETKEVLDEVTVEK
jgi:hypothetical protein